MVVKKDQLNRRKKQETVNGFETLFFVTLGSLSLLFLLIACWFLLTGDEYIFLHGANISPRHICLFLYIQSFFLGQVMSNEHEDKSDVGHLLWSL
jgi:hypothetical protein